MRKMPRCIREFHKEWSLHLMLLLPVIFLTVFRYIPMTGIVISFKNYKPRKGIWGSDWVGIKNYTMLFTMPGFWAAVKNTLWISVAKLILNITVPVLYSIMLNDIRRTKLKRTLQTMVYLPHFVSWVLMAGIVSRLLSQTGLVNHVMTAFGGEPIIFLADKKIFPAIIIFTDVWKEFGYGTIVYLAAIAGIDASLYEAALVDGANYLQRTYHVTLPGMISTIILLTVLSLGRIFDAGFDQVYNLYSPVVYETGDIIDTYIHRLAFGNGQFSLSTAASLFKSVIACTLTVASYRIAYNTTGYRIF
jgi:putative aldouronate transport system permease protein